MAASGDRGHELSVIYSLMKVMLEKEKKATKKQKIIINKWYERMSKTLALLNHSFHLNKFEN